MGHVESFGQMENFGHHRLARHLAKKHGKDEQRLLASSFDVAYDLHEELHTPPPSPTRVDANDIVAFLGDILSHNEDVLYGLICDYDEAGNEVPASGEQEALLNSRFYPSPAGEEGIAHLAVGDAIFEVRIRRVS